MIPQGAQIESKIAGSEFRVISESGTEIFASRKDALAAFASQVAQGMSCEVWESERNVSAAIRIADFPGNRPNEWAPKR